MRKILTLFVMVLFLSSCGGNSNSSAPPPPPPPAPPQALKSDFQVSLPKYVEPVTSSSNRLMLTDSSDSFTIHADVI